jgi:hypothetical protein
MLWALNWCGVTFDTPSPAEARLGSNPVPGAPVWPFAASNLTQRTRRRSRPAGHNKHTVGSASRRVTSMGGRAVRGMRVRAASGAGQ